jgi:hypothetical protein
MKRVKNLDVARTFQNQENGFIKGGKGETAGKPLLSSLSSPAAQPGEQQKHRRQYRPGGTRLITLPQATNIIEAVVFAKSVALHLVAHLTIHWNPHRRW